MSELQRTKFDELEKMEARITEQLKDIKESLKHELKNNKLRNYSVANDIHNNI